MRQLFAALLLVVSSESIRTQFRSARTGVRLSMMSSGLPIDLQGKTVFIGGVADSSG